MISIFFPFLLSTNIQAAQAGVTNDSRLANRRDLLYQHMMLESKYTF